MFREEVGGQAYAKFLILEWLRETQGSTWQIPHPLLAELMKEGEIKLDRVIFRRR